MESSSPAEALPAMSQCFERICLGEAQSLMAYRAFQKGTSPTAMAMLHVGASDLFEESSRILNENSTDTSLFSERLRRFIALNSSLQRIRAYEHMAQNHHDEGKAGHSVAICKVLSDLWMDAM